MFISGAYMFLPRLYSRVSLSYAKRYSRALELSYSTASRSENQTTEADDQKDTIKKDQSEHKVQAVEEFACPNDTNEMQVRIGITRGKKLKPIKANIVVLDARQSGLLRQRELPNYFNRRNHDSKLSILEGVELGGDNEFTRYTDSKSLIDERKASKISSIETLHQIESQRKKLLIFKSNVSREQALRSINYQKPLTTVVSRKRYEQIKQLLESAYTAAQLKAYAKKYYNLPNGNITKPQIVKRILDECWKCTVNDSIDESEDLILERIIDVNTRDMYLLLLTNNGKILNNFARIGATVAVALDENIVIVRGTAPIIRYVEVSLNKILANVCTLKLPIRDIVSHHTERGSVKPFNTEELISLVQRESAVYFEKPSLESGNTSDIYQLSAFGNKRLLKARNLLLWGIQYQPQLTEKVVFHCNETPASFKEFPFTNTECLDWIDRTKEWSRLQKPMVKCSLKDGVAAIEDSKLRLNDEDIYEWYSFLTDESQKAKMVDLESKKEPSKIFSMTLGQILTPFNEHNSTTRTLFEPKISQITSKLLQLPLYDSMSTKDELFTVDQHEYYIQLKFIPDLSSFGVPTKNAPPIELWFELDDYDNAITSTLRCLVQSQQKSLLLKTPHLQHDYKISTDIVSELTESFEENQENWLASQPGIRKFLQESQLTFDNKKKLSIPRSMAVELPIRKHESKIDFNPIQYDYVNANYHRVLRLIYMDKYMVQFSDVNCGPLGGRHTQIDFIGGESLTHNDFKQFVKDICKTF